MIGAGPAGSSVARALAGLGWRTALVERGPRHRGKACGHCLNPRAARLLRSAGLLNDTRRLAVGATRRLRVHAEHCSPVSAELPACEETGPGLLVERHRFDQMLIDRAAEAGVRVLQPASANLAAVGRHEALVEVTQGRDRLRLCCPLVVGADGLRSATAAAAGLGPPARVGRKYGFALDVPLAEAGTGWMPEADTIEMFVTADGYLGIVRHGPGLLHLAGLVGQGVAARSPYGFIGAAARRFGVLGQTGLDDLDPHQCIRLLGAGPIPCRPGRIAAGPVVLVGDAAGYTEPFSGEGMSWALQGAQVLAEVAARREPGSWPSDASRDYQRSWRRHVGRRQYLGRALSTALERPGLGRSLHRVAGRHPSIARWLIGQAVLP